MSVQEVFSRPEAMARFPDDSYRWLKLHDRGKAYGWAAIAERGDDLELHLSLERWGPETRRWLVGDFEWLHREARALGKRRILGIRADGGGECDPRFFRFAGLFGMDETWLFQVAAMDVEKAGKGKKNSPK